MAGTAATAVIAAAAEVCSTNRAAPIRGISAEDESFAIPVAVAISSGSCAPHRPLLVQTQVRPRPSPPTWSTGFSSGPPPASPPAGDALSFNSVLPPPDEIAARLFNATEGKRPRVDNGEDDISIEGGSLGGSGRSGGGGLGFSSSAGGGHGFSSSAGGRHGTSIPPLSSQSSTPQYSSYGGYQGTSKKIEIPSGRVGVIISKGRETIRYLQLQSGAKIQVTRDNEAEPGALTRPVELSGTPEQISKAEQLVNEVLIEVDARSSGGQRYNAPQPGAEQFQMKIGNDKHRGSPKRHKIFPSTSPKTPTCSLPINSSTSLCTPTTSSSPSFRLKNIFMLLLLFTHLQLSSLVI